MEWVNWLHSPWSDWLPLDRPVHECLLPDYERVQSNCAKNSLLLPSESSIPYLNPPIKSPKNSFQIHSKTHHFPPSWKAKWPYRVGVVCHPIVSTMWEVCSIRCRQWYLPTCFWCWAAYWPKLQQYAKWLWRRKCWVHSKVRWVHPLWLFLLGIPLNERLVNECKWRREGDGP